MEKSTKKTLYIFLFVFLGIELQFLAYFLIEAGHISLMNSNPQKYGFGQSLAWWIFAYKAGAAVFFFLGAVFGFFQGKNWWNIIYEKGDALRRRKSLYKKWRLTLERFFNFISRNYIEVKNFKSGSEEIDTVCVGPTGIFTIEIKDHKGILAYYNGHLLVEGRRMKKDFIGKAQKQAAFLSDFISEKLGKRYFVVPMVVFPKADVDESMNFRKDDVWVGDKGFQDYVIKKSNYSIPKKEVLKIVEFLKEEKIKNGEKGN
ncbi:MAG: nuclease-related domain-containing protein [Candidatus Paceibacterota bacterium]|jgi:hypothetical protein|nr:nuclease-related domain-containing protein [Candidatus Paceibacterota bacterium]MDD4830922.1 nuclease-related domain-containing protein [Candidatus Paceibacterota bacterium]MDD4875225.1 nuclease-related domain-containing protein [Candidatus Paceibacterota bacterium]